MPRKLHPAWVPVPRILQRPGKAIGVIINHGCCSNELQSSINNRTLRVNSPIRENFIFNTRIILLLEKASMSSQDPSQSSETPIPRNRPRGRPRTATPSSQSVASSEALCTRSNEQEKLHLARLCVQNQAEHQPGQKGKMKLEKMQESYACLKEPMLRQR
ncbi:hypothetical protein BDZ91DRAFT_751042 [Kalaharituber pfeilii]|nr:hypothetical protein BDZ91DRAFT_751042 [Kalaharituber pfeilii]